MVIRGSTDPSGVLSAIWAAEDGFVVEPNHPCIVLANAIRPIQIDHVSFELGPDRVPETLRPS
jgi:hypothetical protein